MEPADDVAIPFLLMGAFRALVDAVHEQLARDGFPGVRAHHGFALQAIGAGCTSVELGDRLAVSKQAAAKTVKFLEAMGLVERRTNADDRRERIVVVTGRGRTLLDLSATAFRREVSGWRSKVGDGHVDATVATLAAVGSGGRSPTALSDWS
ncbi:MarR family transcriptional regulator [Rhodococcus sp. D2-41]|uniref:MarR family transcriptional regulator n=1 Tax=Speluncibacter jeojiensis TaxID=2710754 RepID=A0A9X4M1Y0_9ACTN|nr:MarR family transcriptional regulator [Rhodococcus sp. D2-41]MDG3008979.1 MarR family transcriptional regulator [Rhodococcus sp. D2-41]MDG3015490.1 MarR family transcriptional regulator [Corynebacteriales bacterium D3-21]